MIDTVFLKSPHSTPSLPSPEAGIGRLRAPALLLVAAVLAANLNVLFSGFVWDDNAIILANPLIRHFHSLPALFSTTFLDSYYRPITLLSFAAEYALWGTRPFGFHLTNLMLHAANALLVLFLIQRLTGSGRAAFVASLLFATHPAQKGVGFISDRTGLLAAFFFLGALICYIRFRDSNKHGRSAISYVMALGLFSLGAFSKEESLTLPLVLVMSDVFFFSGRLKRHPFRPVALHLPFFLIAGFYLYIRSQVVDLPVGMVEASLIEPARRMMTIPFVLLKYLLLLAFPLQMDYDPRIALLNSSFGARVWMSAGMILSTLLFGVVSFRKQRLVSYGILWFFVVFLPMSNLIPVMADIAERELFAPVHFLYLPSVGVFLCAGVGFDRFAARLSAISKPLPKTLLRLAVLLVGILFCLLSMNRNIIWKNDINLFGYMASMRPERASAHANLAAALLHAGKKEEAISHYQQAAALAPDSAEIHNGLGVAFLQAGALDAAVRSFKKSIQLNSDDADTYSNLAVVYAQMGLLKEAALASEKALQLSPSSPNAQLNFGLILMQAGEFGRAEEQLLSVLAADPSDADAHSALARLLERKGEHAQADFHRRQAAISSEK
jgi:Flp pilus assembly protein TadD